MHIYVQRSSGSVPRVQRAISTVSRRRDIYFSFYGSANSAYIYHLYIQGTWKFTLIYIIQLDMEEITTITLSNAIKETFEDDSLIQQEFILNEINETINRCIHWYWCHNYRYKIFIPLNKLFGYSTHATCNSTRAACGQNLSESLANMYQKY